MKTNGARSVELIEVKSDRLERGTILTKTHMSSLTGRVVWMRWIPSVNAPGLKTPFISELTVNRCAVLWGVRSYGALIPVSALELLPLDIPITCGAQVQMIFITRDAAIEGTMLLGIAEREERDMVVEQPPWWAFWRRPRVLNNIRGALLVVLALLTLGCGAATEGDPSSPTEATETRGAPATEAGDSTATEPDAGIPPEAQGALRARAASEAASRRAANR